MLQMQTRQCYVYYIGYEVSPSSDCGNYEIHINGDISQSIMQYFHTTNNTQLLTEYADIVAGIADFWVSRMTYNETLKKYELKRRLLYIMYDYYCYNMFCC